jgi:hypothetical protein
MLVSEAQRHRTAKWENMKRGGGVDTPPLDFLCSFERTPPSILSLNAIWYERLCAKASGAVLCHTPEHESDHGKADPGFFTAGE